MPQRPGTRHAQWRVGDSCSGRTKAPLLASHLVGVSPILTDGPRWAVYGSVGKLGGTLAALGMLLLPVEARAEPPTVSLVYQAPDACPSAKEFAQLVMARVPDVHFVSRAEAHEATVLVQVETSKQRSSGEVRILRAGEAAESRLVEGATCDEAVSALALSVAMAVEMFGSGEAPPVEESPEPLVPEAEATPKTRFSGSLHGLVSWPLSGMALAGAAASFDLRFAWYRLGASSHAGGELSFASDESAEYRLIAAFLELCPLAPIAGRWRFDVCGMLQVGRLHARGTSADVNDQVAPAWAALGGSGRVRYFFSRHLGLEARSYLLAPLTERSFVIDNPSRTVSKTANILPGAALGAVIRFL